jgi:hypothetical protein
MKILYGGATPSGFLRAGEIRRGYPTVANGWAATIAPEEGEVACLLERGDAYFFSGWAVGRPDEIRAYLAAKRPWDTEMFERALAKYA